MKDIKFKEGTLIKGKDLKGYTLCKILSEDMNMRGFQYKIGMNEDVNHFVREESCKAGLYFFLMQDICKYLGYGTVLAMVRIPDEENVYVDAGKFRTHRLEIRETMPLKEVGTWEYLVGHGVDILAEHNYAVMLAVARGHLKVVRYLYENGADITVWENYIKQINKLQKGAVIKGKDLEGYSLCKIISEDMNMRGYQYRIGINLDINPLARKGSCKEGLHFCLAKDACMYLSYGTRLALVGVPDDEDVYVGDRELRTHILRIKKAMSFGEVSTWEYLVGNGANIKGSGNYAVKAASQNGNLEVVEYLHKNGADITAENNYALRMAAENGHLEVVKYLHENGADIKAKNNYAIKAAARKGYLDVVKYLYENSAGDAGQYECALEAASGRADIEEYLLTNKK